MEYVHVLMAVFATWRLTEVFGMDLIFEPIRNIRKNSPWMQSLWRCPKCLSVWAGGFATLAFYFWPWANWPLGLSMIYLLSDKMILRWMVLPSRMMERQLYVPPQTASSQQPPQQERVNGSTHPS